MQTHGEDFPSIFERTSLGHLKSAMGGVALRITYRSTSDYRDSDITRIGARRGNATDNRGHGLPNVS
jgi:hypothetical protein